MAMSQQSLLKFFGRQIEKSAEKRKTPPVVQGFGNVVIDESGDIQCFLFLLTID
jgi:hypothetical protein